MESNTPLYPPQAESQSCFSGCIGPRPATALPPHHLWARGPDGPALSPTGVTTPLSHLLQPATASCLLVLQATLQITYSLSVTVHLSLWSKSQLMEWGKVKHSNNGDSCFSLFEKIHFVLLSAPSSSPRPALNSSRRLLLPGLISGRRQGKGETREKEPWSQWTLCREMWQESPTHLWALSTPKWSSTEIKMGVVGHRQLSLWLVFWKGEVDGCSMRSKTIQSGNILRSVRGIHFIAVRAVYN